MARMFAASGPFFLHGRFPEQGFCLGGFGLLPVQDPYQPTEPAIQNSTSMITLFRLTQTDTREYRFMEELLTAAFPPEEYRELGELRRLTCGRPVFHNNLICDDDRPVGLVTFWDFGDFHYIEHFATLPAMRNKGYGHRVLELLGERLRTPLVLEAELPVEELARRRVGFYARQGFRTWPHDYRQPPYRAGGEPLPMVLMFKGDPHFEECFGTVRDRIYREVYGC